jgi:hypothetical protein
MSSAATFLLPPTAGINGRKASVSSTAFREDLP